MNCIKEKKIYVKKKKKALSGQCEFCPCCDCQFETATEYLRKSLFSWLVSSTVCSTIHHLKAQEIMAMQKTKKLFFYESNRQSSICVYPQTFICIIYERFVASFFSFHYFESGRMGIWE